MILAVSTLEIVQVVISASIPVAIFGAGALLARQAREYEARQWIRRKRYDTRLERWQEIAHLLNDLLCFFMLFGHFREVTPPEAIKRKRQLDRAVYANQHIFGESFLTAYNNFMSLGFKTYVGVGRDALIRAPVRIQSTERGSTWQDRWSELFVSEQEVVPSRDELAAAYNALLKTYDEL